MDTGTQDMIARQQTRRLRILAALIWLGASVASANADSVQAQLKIVWTAPVTVTHPPDRMPHATGGMGITGVAADPEGGVALFGLAYLPDEERPVLLHHAERGGPEGASALPIPTGLPPSRATGVLGWLQPSPPPPPFVRGLAFGAHGEIWMAGNANRVFGFASDPDSYSDALLAKLDAEGRPLDTWTWRGNGVPGITNILALPEDGIVATGAARADSSWLGRIDDEGRLHESYRLGLGKGIALARAGNGSVLVAAFTARGRAAEYRDSVSLWRLGPDGDLSSGWLLREDLNRNSGASFGTLAMSGTGDGAYVASAWNDTFTAGGVRPAEVVRVTSEGRVLWRQTLAESLTPDPHERQAVCGTAALSTLPDGDALLACTQPERLQIHRLEAATGRQQTTWFPRPDCQKSGLVRLFLLPAGDSAVWVAGTPAALGKSGCSWLGRLEVAKVPALP